MANLNTHWSFTNVENEKEQIKAYWAKKMPRIERLIANYPPDLTELRITVYYHPRRKKWEFRAVLYLPTGTLATQETRMKLNEALDVLADELVRQIKRHKELVRKDYIYRRRRQSQRNLSAAAPLVQSDIEEQRQEAFFELMQPLMQSIRDYAQREIAILESDGLIPKNEIEPQELVDAVLTQAWETYEDRPKKLDLHDWLFQLMHEQLEQLIAAHRELSTEVEIPGTADEPMTPEGDLDEVDYWLERIFVDLGDETLEEIIPDPEADDPEQRAERDETQHAVRRALARLPRLDRTSLLWHEVDGLDIKQIAMIQNRSEEEVRKSIQRGKALLACQLADLATQLTQND